MNRLNEIKERVAKVIKGPEEAFEEGTKEAVRKWADDLTYNANVFRDNSLQDVQYLLAKLEIAQKALLRIAYETLDDGGIAMTACMELGIEPDPDR